MLLVTFSGLDGCGKTTHVALTCAHLARRGYHVRELVTLGVSATGLYARLREAVQRRWRRSRGVDDAHAPQRPRIRTYRNGRTFDADRRDVVVRLRRMVCYPLDCLALRAVIWWLGAWGYTAIVCDRYTFDKLVSLPNPDCRLARLMRRLAPRPDHAIFLDAPPEAASRRKLEHEPDYYQTKYNDYRRLVQMRIGLTAIPSTSIPDTQCQIEASLAAADQPFSHPQLRCYEKSG